MATTAREGYRKAAETLRRAAEKTTGYERAGQLEEAARYYREAELHGMAGWCERHAAITRTRGDQVAWPGSVIDQEAN
jgi:hypothetical protein